MVRGDFPGSDAAPYALPADFAALSLLAGCELHHVSTLRGHDFVALDLSTRCRLATLVLKKESPKVWGLKSMGTPQNLKIVC